MSGAREREWPESEVWASGRSARFPLSKTSRTAGVEKRKQRLLGCGTAWGRRIGCGISVTWPGALLIRVVVASGRALGRVQACVRATVAVRLLKQPRCAGP